MEFNQIVLDPVKKRDEKRKELIHIISHYIAAPHTFSNLYNTTQPPLHIPFNLKIFQRISSSNQTSPHIRMSFAYKEGIQEYSVTTNRNNPSTDYFILYYLHTYYILHTLRIPIPIPILFLLVRRRK